MRPRAPASIHEEESLGKAYDARLLRRLWHYVRPHRGLAALSLVLLLLVGGVQLVQPYLIKLAIDDHIAVGRTEGLLALAGLFLFPLLAEFLLNHFILRRLP